MTKINSYTKIVGGTLGLALLPQLVKSEVALATPNSDVSLWAINNIFVVMSIITIAIVLSVIWKVIGDMSTYEQERILKEQGIALKPKAEKQGPSFVSNLIGKLSSLVPLEKEVDIQLDHDYDGIKELDNSLPPWWLYLFYFTIVWGVAYFYVYQLSDYGKSQSEEYAISVKAGEDVRLAYLAKQADSVDETNVVYLEDQASLSTGKSIYMGNCLACHGAEGQGGVGPNMTDEYWIHGGGIKNIFKTIKYGVPEKGMIAWNTQLSPSDMQKVASFIMTFQGTNPPNAKKAQGELYVLEESSESDD